MSVLNSRRVWTFVLAQLTSGAALGVGLYINDPAALQITTWFIGFVEGLAAILITLLTIDDSRLNTAQTKADAQVEIAAINAGTHPDFPPCAEDGR